MKLKKPLTGVPKCSVLMSGQSAALVATLRGSLVEMKKFLEKFKGRRL